MSDLDHATKGKCQILGPLVLILMYSIYFERVIFAFLSPAWGMGCLMGKLPPPQ